MAFSTINKSSDYMNTVLYTGNTSTNAITGVDFQPDFTWIKDRDSGTFWHNLFDVQRTTYSLSTNSTDAQTDRASDGFTSLDSDGFTLNGSGSGGNVNRASNYVSWNWKANGAGSANTDGSINSTVSVNTTAGFSIVKFTGTGANATVGHGLGVAPSFYVVKRIDGGDGGQWNCYHKSLGATDYLILNSEAAKASSSTRWNNTAPTSSVFTVGTSGDVNDSGDTHIAYCFAEVAGYSKMGKYTGNGNDANGTFVYTGFKPSFVLIKKTSGDDNWTLSDHKRDADVSPNFARLAADTTAAESTNITWARINKFSNGFRLGGTDSVTNESDSTYIYMAFGQPIISNSGVCATAR